jgi:hypothetical protein
MDNVDETPVAQAKPKKSFKRRLISWVIQLAIIGIVGYYVVGLKSEQKDKFVEGVAAAAMQKCDRDTACIENLKANFSSCLSSNHETQKSGKFNRKYILDEEGFYGCLERRR